MNPTISKAGTLDYHRAADFIEAVRQLGIEHGYVLARGIEHQDDPKEIPRLRFHVMQTNAAPLDASPITPGIMGQIMADLKATPT